MKALLLFIVLGFAKYASASIHTEMLDGFISAALHLMTPETGADRSEELDATRKKYEGFKTAALQRIVETKSAPRYDPDSAPYFKIIPRFECSATPGVTSTFSGPCFGTIAILSHIESDGSLVVTVDLRDAASLLCHESIIFATDSETHVKEFFLSGSHQVTFAPQHDEARVWDLYDRGPRVFVYPITLEKAIANLAETALLFEPVLTEGVSEYFAQINLDFLEKFAGIVMPERTAAPEVVDIPRDLINSGDTFDILRLDGLDPMIAWAMGAATGHTAVALWNQNDELFLCESNVESPYWPTNGVQCNPYDDWIEFGRHNDYNVVWAPLAPKYVDMFNETAAWEYFNAMEGVDYGWEIVLTGWLDTLDGNSVCADNNKTMCSQPETFEMIFSLVEDMAVLARVFKPAIMQRAGVPFDRPIVEAYHQAFKSQGIPPRELHLVPEQHGWLYNTTRFGTPEMSTVAICNVFACNVWKAAGLFADAEVNCEEFAVNDNYRLDFYGEYERPPACVEADPDNPLCQVLGKYSLRLDSQPGVMPRYNYVPLHDHFGEKCTTLAPEYLASPEC